MTYYPNQEAEYTAELEVELEAKRKARKDRARGLLAFAGVAGVLLAFTDGQERQRSQIERLENLQAETAAKVHESVKHEYAARAELKKAQKELARLTRHNDDLVRENTELRDKNWEMRKHNMAQQVAKPETLAVETSSGTQATTKAAESSSDKMPYFGNCTAARAAGWSNFTTRPGSRFDRDKDGIGCES